MRPLTILCFLAFAGAGAWLYQVKHQVAMKDRELLEIRREIEQARQRMDILRAEWALLNEPERLRQAASRIVALEPMQPTHFVRLSELPRRLPGAVAFAGAPDIFAPSAAAIAAATPPAAQPAATPAVTLAAARPAAQGTAAAASAGAEAPSPQALAAAIAEQRAATASQAEANARAEAARLARVEAARAARAEAARVAARPIQPAVHVAPAPVITEPRTRMTQATPPPRAAAPMAAPVSAPMSVLGAASALGRPLLAPPVPIASPAAAATLR